MTRRVIVLPQAIDDIDDAAFVIGLDSPQAGLRFGVLARATCTELADMPRKGRRIANARNEEWRRWPVRDFENYLIFYRVLDDCIEIIRILHGARDLDALFDD